jgi:maltose-binding protein MalE
MINQKITKSLIVVMTAALLMIAAAVVIPANMVHAQGNATQTNATQTNASQTEGNLTAVIDVDTLSKNIKERHPILGQMAADEDKDIIVVIKGMDPKEALKTVIALNMLRLLQQYKQVDVS